MAIQTLMLRLLLFVSITCGMLGTAGAVVAQEASPVASPKATTDPGLEPAVAWLTAQQAEDGGFAGFTGESDPGFTLDALIALGAARNAGLDTTEAIDAAVEYLRSEDRALVYAQTEVGQSAKLILGLSAVGENPEGFASVLPLSILQAGQDEATGIYDHALTMLAFSVLGEETPDSAVEALAATQAANGGWSWDASADDATADSNTTSMVVQALAAAGFGDDDMVTQGMSFLESTWTEGGAAYDLTEGAIADANSTSLVIQATIAMSVDVDGWLPTLLSFQNPTGALHFNAEDLSDNAYSTVQAIPVLAGQAFPFAPVSITTPAARANHLAR